MVCMIWFMGLCHRVYGCLLPVLRPKVVMPIILFLVVMPIILFLSYNIYPVLFNPPPIGSLWAASLRWL